MNWAVPGPALPTVAVAMSSTARCADVSNLPLWPITHSGQFERISTGSPAGSSPVAHGMALGMSAWRLQFEKETFFLVSLGCFLKLQNCR